MIALVGSILCLSLTASSAIDRTYTLESFGFRVQKPDDTWIWSTSEREGQALFMWTTFPRGGAGIPGFVVYVTALNKDATAESLREAAAAKLATLGGKDFVRSTARVHDGGALSVRCRMTSEEYGEYALSYAYVVAPAYVYTLQRAERAGDDAQRRDLDAVEASFETFAPTVQASEGGDAKLRALAQRCGSEIEWCTDWKCAAERAEAENKLILATFQNYRALALPEVLKSGPFMDPDFVALVNERFIAFRMEVETDAPFREPDAFGMSRWSFGTSLMFIDSKAHVVRETSVEDAAYLHELARDVLHEHGRDAAAKPEKSADKLDVAARLLRRGELDAAEKSLQSADSSRAHELRAALFRMKRDGRKALDELRAARAQASDAKKLDLDVAQAVILMRLARYDEARELFQRAVDAEPAPPSACEALFWLGTLDVLAQGFENGVDRWRRLVAEHPDDRWAWKAAANLLKEGEFILGGERLDWPESDLVAAVTRPRAERVDDAQRERMERDALHYLITHQHDDGSWICPADAFGVGRSLYTPAINALCGASLVPFASEKDAAACLTKAIAWSLDAHATKKLEGSEGITGVYSIWSRTFTALFFARCVRAKVGDVETIGKALGELVVSIEGSQHVHGGWPYVFLPDDPKGEGLDPSASFLTAGVVLALLEARDAGAKVSDDVIAGALRFLERVRQEDGSFGYFTDLPAHAVDGEFPEGAGRGPICALALYRGGRGSLDELRARLKTFVKHEAYFAREWHKELCHTSPQGFGAHYIFYDYGFASAAVRALPSAERAPFAKELVHEIAGARFADGSFEDMPLLGRAYGTAMALLSLRELRSK